MTIRPFDPADSAAVIALWRDVFAYSAPHNDPATALAAKLRFQPELLFVASIDGTIAGTVMAGYDGHRGWIYSLAVAPAARKNGVGSALVRHAEKALADLGCRKVNLQLLASNADTVKFYESLGYKVEERISMGKVL